MIILGESSLQKLRNAHIKNLENVDTEIEALMRDLGPNLLKITMGDLKKMLSLEEATKDKTVCDFNLTMKEALEKPDEGKPFRTINFALKVFSNHHSK